MIAIAFALEFESVCFCARHDPRLRVGVWLLGAMGVGAAKIASRILIDTMPALLISAGFSGGLQPDLKLGIWFWDKIIRTPKVVAGPE